MAKLVNTIKEWLFPTHHLVDLDDRFILFSGTYHQCEDVMEQSYGGNLHILTEQELPEDIYVYGL